MEFHNLGKHCSFPDCKQLDFLPFTCDVCKRIYCLDHRKYEDHGCANAQSKDKRAYACPICNSPIAPKPGQDPNVALDEHINRGCAKTGPKSFKCNVKGCKTVELVPFPCKKCRTHHCIKHRFENDHGCPGRPVAKKSSTTNTTAATTTSRSSTSQPPSKNSPNSTSRPSSGNAYPYGASNPNNNNSSKNNNNNSSQYPGASRLATVGVRLTDGRVIRHTFEPTATLRDVQRFIDQNRIDGDHPYVMRTTYPKKEFSFQDLDKKLTQLGLVPSGMIILHFLPGMEPQQSNSNSNVHTIQDYQNNNTNNNNSPNNNNNRNNYSNNDNTSRGVYNYGSPSTSQNNSPNYVRNNNQINATDNPEAPPEGDDAPQQQEEYGMWDYVKSFFWSMKP